MSLITAALSTGWDIISAEASSQGMSCSCWVAGCRFLFPVPSALHRGPHDPCSSCAKGHAPATGQLAVSFFHEFDLTTSLQCLYLQFLQCRGIGATVKETFLCRAVAAALPMRSARLPASPCDQLEYTHMCNSVLKSSVLGHGWMDSWRVHPSSSLTFSCLPFPDPTVHVCMHGGVCSPASASPHDHCSWIPGDLAIAKALSS